MLKLTNKILNKILIIMIYLITLIALISIMIEFFNNVSLQSVANNEIEALILRFYKNADKGDYKDLYNITIEGKWKKIDSAKNQNYYFIGIAEKDYFINRSIKDFGEDGWKIYSSNVEIIGSGKISRSELSLFFLLVKIKF